MEASESFVKTYAKDTWGVDVTAENMKEYKIKVQDTLFKLITDEKKK